MKERVVAAMSGGVDSAVAAALLQKRGYEVIGMTMCFNLTDSARRRPSCCGLQGIEDARRVAHKLGIRHYVINMQKALREQVIQDFCREYLRGRTPNPCVRCNQYLKFGALLKKAFSLGARYLATGHYARIAKSKAKPQIYFLRKAKDTKKDQSYFLYRLGQEQLSHILFPLGNYTKEEVRRIAKEFSLPVADKLASQEICFLPNSDYREFLKNEVKKDIEPGLIMDKEGQALGEHKGIAFYTVGQREGLGIARGYPLYITKIDAQNNRIITGRKEDAYASGLMIRGAHFIYPVRSGAKKKVALKVKIRYNHQEAPVEADFLKGKIKIKFKKPQFAITPGQSAVFYDRDKVLGGGIIDKAL